MPAAILHTVGPIRAWTTRGVGWGVNTSLRPVTIVMWFVPCPSCPYSGEPAERTSPPQSHSVNSPPQAAVLQPETCERTGSARQSQGRPFTGAPLRTWPVPSCPHSFEPQAKASPSATTATEWWRPAEMCTTRLPLSSPATTCGVEQAGRSGPRPSCPRSPRPQDHTRPSAPSARQCAPADPQATRVTRTPTRGARRCGRDRLSRCAGMYVWRPTCRGGGGGEWGPRRREGGR